MKKVLIPTDFSDTASNAARFMAAWSHHAPFSEMILLHSYAPLRKETYLIDILESDEFDSAPQADSVIRLQKFKDTLLPLIHSGSISMISTASGWEDSIRKAVSHEHIDLVATGILPFGKNTRETIGKIVSEITRSLQIPLILIPANVSFLPIDAIVLACDINDTVGNFPASSLKELLANNPARIYVVSIYANHQDAEREDEEAALFQILDPQPVEFHYIDAEDVVSAILDFAIEKRARLIVSTPKEHNFLESLFQTSVSQHLAESASVPVMLLYK